MARRLAEHVSEQCPDLDTLISYVKRWEAGKVGVSDRYRVAYAAAFGMGVDDLFDLDAGARSSLWRPAGLNGEFTPDDEERLTLVSLRPARLDSGTLETLATVLAAQRRLEDAVGAAALLAPVAGQLDVLMVMLRDASGPLRDQLGRIVAEWTVYTGWLHAALRRDAQALALFGRGEELADEFGDGTIAAVATSFRGYVARRQGRPHAVVRAASAALATPGGHPVQRTFDQLQAAQGYAALGDVERARRLLDSAAERAADGVEPPPPVYWYSEAFFQLNIGMVLGDIGEYSDAAALLGEGLRAMPPEQAGAEWLGEYRAAFDRARDRA
ncbi:hypothetical protein Arub01_29100 [Actinomadura rubrobrunea]|uniref:XRE family transcriptional regulator n=1 Tax=Actinomadura rubrobrunea TaxID=115335 RepID=A0A9W6UUI5_9ACTN|nr:hypothetical protein [Actinomadura rubrobrunea]GLW64666.1 hypothetical protein Arub01_29100 [Actinomadura rubrobrunea]